MNTPPLRRGRAALTLSLSLALVLPLLSATASAQWQWVDGTGRKVFSDTAPPASIPERNILKRPSMPAPAPIASPDTASATGAPPGASPTAAVPASPATPTLPNGKDADLEARKKQAEAAEQAKQKAEADRLARARVDNCERARKSRAMIDSGQRLATLNAKGEREFMDDKTRSAESQRLDQVIRSDCGPIAR